MILILAASCAGCVSTVSDGFENVPEWFEQRRGELAGSSYPDLKSAVKLSDETESAPWNKIEDDLTLAMRDMKRSDPGGVTITAEEMRAWASEQQALVAKGEEPY